MAQYPIPQFIEEEGKIISFLTFRQFFIVTAGGAVCIAFYYTLPLYLFVPGALFTLLITAAIGFGKINNTPIPTLVLNFFNFSLKPKNYVWQKKESKDPFRINQIYTTKQMPQLKDKPNQPTQLTNTNKIIELRKRK